MPLADAVTKSNVQKKFVLCGLDSHAAIAHVNSVDGLEEPGHSHSGGGGGAGYTTKNRSCRINATSAYGINAVRGDGRGGYSAGMMFQYNFGKTTLVSDRAFEGLRGVRVPIR